MNVFAEIHEIVLDKLFEARPKDIVWGFFAFNAVLLSWAIVLVNRSLQRRHERKMRAQQVDNRSVRGIFFDFTGATLRAQPLPKFSLKDWDASLRNLVRTWRSPRGASHIIVPDNAHDVAALEDLIHTEASEMLIRSINGIRGFLQDDQIVSEADGFRHVRFLVALVRPPKDSITWFDAARLVIIPVKSARQIAAIPAGQDFSTRLSGRNKETWVAILQQMGLRYLQSHGKRKPRLAGLTTVDIAFDC